MVFTENLNNHSQPIVRQPIGGGKTPQAFNQPRKMSGEEELNFVGDPASASSRRWAAYHVCGWCVTGWKRI